MDILTLLGTASNVAAYVMEGKEFTITKAIKIDNKTLDIKLSGAVVPRDSSTLTDYTTGTILTDIFIAIENIVVKKTGTFSETYAISAGEGLTVTLSVNVL